MNVINWNKQCKQTRITSVESDFQDGICWMQIEKSLINNSANDRKFWLWPKAFDNLGSVLFSSAPKALLANEMRSKFIQVLRPHNRRMVRFNQVTLNVHATDNNYNGIAHGVNTLRHFSYALASMQKNSVLVLIVKSEAHIFPSSECNDDEHWIMWVNWSNLNFPSRIKSS